MEKLILRYNSFVKALQTLENSVHKLQTKQYNDYAELRDSLIQRFEYSADTFWKVLKDYLRVILSIEVDIARPKIVFNECHDAKLISREELTICIELIEDRNVTSHGYNEKLAEDISAHIPKYCNLMRTVIKRLQIPSNDSLTIR